MFYDGGVEINAAVLAIEKFLETYSGVSASQVRPSGDDLDVIKVWLEVQAADPKDFGAKAETAIRAAVPGAAGFRIQVRAESFDTKPVRKP
jgi:hypothetical protein